MCNFKAKASSPLWYVDFFSPNMGLRLVESHSFSPGWKIWPATSFAPNSSILFSLCSHRILNELSVYGNGGSVSTKHRISRSFNQSEIRPVPCTGCVNVAFTVD